MTLAQGLGQELDPDFVLFAFSKPNVEKILEKKYKPSSIIRRLPPSVAEMALYRVDLPNRLARIIKSVEPGNYILVLMSPVWNATWNTSNVW